jgi:hypothetical protein
MPEPVPVFTGTLTSPYPHYTQCTTADNYSSLNQYIQMAIAAVIAGGVALAIVGASTIPWCYVLAAEIGLMAGGLAYCNWWLNDRLICLPADVGANSGPAVDVCAVGMFVTKDQNDPSIWPYDLPDLDTDWTMDIVLYGTESGAPVDVLIGETQAIKNLGLGFENGGNGQTDSFVLQGVYDGSSEAYMNGGVTVTSPILHCEVEGAGVYDYQNWLTTFFWVAVAGLIAQEALAAIPGIGTIVSAIIALLAFLASLLGFYTSENDQASAPTAPGGSQPLNFNPPGSATGNPASVVCVVGTWVYDSAHDGWNEIHPAKYIQAIGTTGASIGGDYAWDPSWASQCGMVAQANSPPTQGNQALPANQWIIYPLVDGCGSYPAGPPPPPIK